CYPLDHSARFVAQVAPRPRQQRDRVSGAAPVRAGLGGTTPPDPPARAGLGGTLPPGPAARAHGPPRGPGPPPGAPPPVVPPSADPLPPGIAPPIVVLPGGPTAGRGP